jgi:hypothetical protein
MRCQHDNEHDRSRSAATKDPPGPPPKVLAHGWAT